MQEVTTTMRQKGRSEGLLPRTRISSPVEDLLFLSSSVHNFGFAYNNSLQVAIAIIPLILFRHGTLHPLRSSSGSRDSVFYFTCRIVSDTKTRSYLPGARNFCDNRSPECCKVLLISVTLPLLIRTRSFIQPLTSAPCSVSFQVSSLYYSLCLFAVPTILLAVIANLK